MHPTHSSVALCLRAADQPRRAAIFLVELALKNAEEDIGYRLGRNFTLPRGVSYRGGVGGGKALCISLETTAPTCAAR